MAGCEEIDSFTGNTDFCAVRKGTLLVISIWATGLVLGSTKMLDLAKCGIVSAQGCCFSHGQELERDNVNLNVQTRFLASKARLPC